MTNISKQKINGNDYTIAYQTLVQFIGKLKGTKAACIIDELLTEAEKIMVVKRFAAIYMFKKEYSPYRVSHTISISISTAQRIYEQYKNENFKKLLKQMTQKDEHEFLSLINDLIIAQASPKARARLLKRTL